MVGACSAALAWPGIFGFEQTFPRLVSALPQQPSLCADYKSLNLLTFLAYSTQAFSP